MVLSPNWIGDVVMATPLLSILRRAFSGDLITVLCRTYVSELLARCPFADRLVTYDRRGGAAAAVRALRADRPRGGWEAAFVLPPSISSALTALLAGCRRRVGYGAGMRRLLLSDVPGPAAPRTSHLSNSYAALAALLGAEVPWPLPAPTIVAPYDWRERVGAAGLAGPYAVLAAGAMYGPAKMWPAARYAALARMIAEERGIVIAVVGSQAERAYVEAMIRCSGTRSANLAGRLDLGALIAVLRGARVVVGNDSGPVHISAALGVPTVTVFGSTSPAWTAPLGPRSRVVAADMDCSPCFRRACPDGGARCLENISPEAVMDAAREAMRENGYENWKA